MLKKGIRRLRVKKKTINDSNQPKFKIKVRMWETFSLATLGIIVVVGGAIGPGGELRDAFQTESTAQLQKGIKSHMLALPITLFGEQ